MQRTALRLQLTAKILTEPAGRRASPMRGQLAARRAWRAELVRNSCGPGQSLGAAVRPEEADFPVRRKDP